MILETVDKFCILPWSNSAAENVIIFCRICGRFSSNFGKNSNIKLGGLFVGFTDKLRLDFEHRQNL